MAAFSITADHQPVIEALNRLAYVFTAPGMRPAMKEIGERLSDSTKDRFQASVAPDGSAWEPISPITRFLRSKKGRPGAKPLIDTGQLSRTIRYQITDGGAGVIIGTHRSFGDANVGVHQFGTSRAGRGHNVTIPARPFLGLSPDDEKTVLDIIQSDITKAISG